MSGPDRSAGRAGHSEDELRRMLAERAAQAPAGEPLTERVLVSLSRGTGPRPHPYRWLVPAAAVALVAAGIGAVAGLPHRTHHSGGRAGRPVSTDSTGLRANAAPRRTPADAGRFRATGVSFDAAGDGFAIGAGTLLRYTAGRWSAAGVLPGPVEAVRFATAQVGYVFGPDAFFATSDGGRTWTRSSGGAIAVDVAGRTTLRLAATGLSRRSAAGWQPVPIAGLRSVPVGARLATSGERAYVAAGNAVYASTDSGDHWSALSVRACPTGRLVDVAAAADAVLAACQGEKTEVYRLRPAPARLARVATAATARLTTSGPITVVAAGPVYRVSAGQTVPVGTVPAASGTALYLGFQPGAGQVVHYVGSDGSVLWSSADGGSSWTSGVIG